ncbi:MAG: hypothetical protein J6Z08_09115 [Elusimicrobiales bacterium]|jgi:hypothetical protein|nr:hypothetical protein [Elusimicrobiales bacterium]
MAELVKKCGIKKEEGFLYFVDKAGDISCAKASRGNKKGGKTKKVQKVGITKEKGYLYFVDKKGDISRAAMKNSGVETPKKAAKKTTAGSAKKAVKATVKTIKKAAKPAKKTAKKK